MKAKIHWSGGSPDLRFGCEMAIRWPGAVQNHRTWTADMFVERASYAPDLYCTLCAKAARLAAAKESSPARSVKGSCTRCRSGAINPKAHGRTEGADIDLCDVCYWRKRAAASYCARCAGAAVRTDSDRYAELRKLVESWQTGGNQGVKDNLLQWRHR